MLKAFVYIAVLLIVAVAVMVLMLWQHKKAGTGDIQLLGALASVEETLRPEGAVLVRGDLWRACLKPSTKEMASKSSNAHPAHVQLTAKQGSKVRVVGVAGFLLEVELMN